MDSSSSKNSRWSYIKIKGQWKYLYRAVDTSGQTIDFLLTAKRDAASALRNNSLMRQNRHYTFQSSDEIIDLDALVAGLKLG